MGPKWSKFSCVFWPPSNHIQITTIFCQVLVHAIWVSPYCANNGHGPSILPGLSHTQQTAWAFIRTSRNRKPQGNALRWRGNVCRRPPHTFQGGQQCWKRERRIGRIRHICSETSRINSFQYLITCLFASIVNSNLQIVSTSKKQLLLYNVIHLYTESFWRVLNVSTGKVCFSLKPFRSSNGKITTNILPRQSSTSNAATLS